MPTPEQELEAAIAELERTIQRQVRFWQRPMETIGRDEAERIQQQVEAARDVLRSLFRRRP